MTLTLARLSVFALEVKVGFYRGFIEKGGGLKLMADKNETTADDIAERDRIAKNYRPGTFGCHELLHITMVARDFVEEHVSNHPTIGLNREWEALAEKATDALFELYQAIGKEHL